MCQHAGTIEMAGKYMYIEKCFSPGMITIVLILPSAPEVGGRDDSGEDTFEVIPVKLKHLHHPCTLNLYPYNKFRNSPEHAH